LVFELLQELRGHWQFSRLSAEEVEAMSYDAMESRIRTEQALPGRENRTRIAALIGPPGCGKTTALVKLAARYGLNSRRPCVLVSADSYRIGAGDQLRSYAGILGLSFDTALTPSSLGQLLEEHRNKDLILVDTPGLGRDELMEYEEWPAFFSSRDDIEKHLVLSASMKNADLSFVVDRYRMFGPNRLLFTKLDETATQGSIWSEAVRTGLPLSYWTSGQKIPEDIETASKPKLIDTILKRERKPRSASAGM
jgi:flagellar biosynthesis protein FlhF